MRIQIINPNTTAAFTRRCQEAGRRVAAGGTEVLAGNPGRGVASVECSVDEAVATLGILEQVQAGNAAGVDAFVIACFGDTGLEAARELARGPVVGMTEAALYLAALVAPVFAVITLPVRTRVFAERALHHAGLAHRCPRIRAIDVAVADCEEEGEAVLGPFLAEARRAIAEDQAEAIVLGCAGLMPLVEPLTRELGVPVIEGVAAAVKLAESLVALGLATSRRGAWAPPLHPPPLPWGGGGAA